MSPPHMALERTYEEESQSGIHLINTGEWLFIATRWLQEPVFSSGSDKASFRGRRVETLDSHVAPSVHIRIISGGGDSFQL